MKHTSKAALLGLPLALVLLATSPNHAAAAKPVGASTPKSTASSALKDFFTFPFRDLSSDESGSHSPAYPFFGTRKLHERAPTDKNVLFSFTLTGSAARRQKERLDHARRGRVLEELLWVDTEAVPLKDKRFKPDVIIKLPDGRQITIDAKEATTHDEYLAALEAALQDGIEAENDATTHDDYLAALEAALQESEEVAETTHNDHSSEVAHTTHDDHSSQVADTTHDTHDSDHGDGHAESSSSMVEAHDDEHGDTHDTDAHGATGTDAHSDGHGDAHDDAHSMVVHVTYEDIYAILLFLIVATGAGVVTAKLGMPALVGEIFVGFLMGPPLADFVPYPEALVLVGEIGLIMLLLEAGVELDVAQLRETGARALAIGFTGTCLPLLVGMGLGMANGMTNFKAALAVGASFSPTSLGVAAGALKAGKMSDTPVGQLIVASCVIDDILALILLSMFKVLVKDDPAMIEYFIPIISSVGFLVILGGLSVTYIPRFIENQILKKCSEGYRELVMFTVMAVMVLAYLPMLNYTQASYLMGAFLAGVTFSQIEHAHHAFMHSTHQLMTWLLRVFFAASIGFQVPVKLFAEPKVILWGFILYLCVAAKMPLMFYVPQFEDVKKGASYNPFLRDRLITALAMSCRGEMSFIIASFALGEGLFPAQMYASIVFAVLISCITSPFMLLNLIKYFNKKQLEYLSATNPLKMAKGKKGKAQSTPLFLHVKVKAPAFGGMQEKFRKIVNELGLEVAERRTNRNGKGLDATVQTDLYVRDTTMTVRLQKIKGQRKIRNALHAAIESSGTEAKSMRSMFCKQGSIKVSSGSLSNLSLASLEKEEKEAIERHAAEEDSIIERGNHVEKTIQDALEHGAKVVVDVWNPWPWTEVLDKICTFYGLSGGGPEDVDVFVAIFDKIDSNGGGEIDQEEMYEALVTAGLDITEEGVITLVNMIDDDGNGDVDRDEWRETVEFYLELKAEKKEMQEQQSVQKELRKKNLAKLAALGVGTSDGHTKVSSDEEMGGTAMQS